MNERQKKTILVVVCVLIMTVLRMINVVTGMMRTPVTKEQLMNLNAELNKIPIK